MINNKKLAIDFDGTIVDDAYPGIGKAKIFAFDTLKMERVEFRADNENKRSIQAMKNIGCTVEGILRKNTYKPDGSRRDSIVLSILKEEWNKTIKNELKTYINFE